MAGGTSSEAVLVSFYETTLTIAWNSICAPVRQCQQFGDAVTACLPTAVVIENETRVSPVDTQAPWLQTAPTLTPGTKVAARRSHGTTGH